MTQEDITDRRLRRIHARIRHLNALLRLRAIRGGGAGSRGSGSRRRKEGHGETGRMWSVDRTIILVTGSAGYQPRHGKKAGGAGR